jgi:putative membrane protein
VVEVLPTFNALLNATSGVLLLAAWRFIKAGRRDTHKKLMIAAFSCSALFLVFYLIRFSLTGAHRFAGADWLKPVYYAILFSHMLLAAAVVPLALRTFYLSYFKHDYTRHRRIARWTFPIWLYVSVTGVIVYVMLYHLA